MDVKGESQRAVIYDLCKQAFVHMAFWRRIEEKLAVLCSDIPEATNEEKKVKIVEALRRIREFILEQGVEPGNLIFLDEEIDRYDNTFQISLYEEKDDQVPPEVVEKYVRKSDETEGVIGIHLALNYEQLKRLTNAVFRRTSLVKFYISRERTLYGKVVAEIYDHPQDIIVARLAYSKARDDADDAKVKYIALFGEKVDPKKYVVAKEIPVQMHVYRFVSEHNQEFILLNPAPIEMGDYVVTGVVTKCDDHKQLTDSSRLLTKLPFLFVHDLRSRIVKFASHEEFRARIGGLGIARSTLFEFPFSPFVPKRKAKFTTAHPSWFKWLIWAWLAHKGNGFTQEWPLHIMVVGPKGSGKTTLFETLHAVSKETDAIFSGQSSTLKGLIPSFKNTPPKPGYLPTCNRFAFLDEFLGCVMKVGNGDGERDETLSKMNDLLEHKKREFTSGTGRLGNTTVRARIIAATNPIKEVHSVRDLLRKLPESFCSRWLIYYQQEEGQHVRMFRESLRQQHIAKPYTFELSENDWVSILDYLWTFEAEYDLARIEKVYQMPLLALSPDLRNHYEPRHFHHLECLIDGLVKARCLFEHDMRFMATEEDYLRLEEVWLNVIRSWTDAGMVQQLPARDRLYYLPENAQWFFSKVCAARKPLTRIETEELALAELSKREYTEAYIILRENGLIYEDGEVIKPHYMRDGEGDETTRQQRLTG